ncbi:hypothetical protein [Dermacoccus nishinomiyaensis]|uniref:hypothetical protein n=1 Tax=Dermacoccus nishinomiyaensis TaxID=1274 RepID=UPI000938B0D6|nr:hypothetical protein [Dermacoccus nishinomiyaensis]
MLDAVPWSTLGPAGLLALAVLLIIRGDLIPRKQFDEMVADRDFWRELAQRKDVALDEMTEIARTSGRVLDALPAATEAAARTQGAER